MEILRFFFCLLNKEIKFRLGILSEIENPYMPTTDEVEAWAAHLAYAQFSEAEMKDGTAWNILNSDGKTWIPSVKDDQ